jgi:hypothetical protein
VDQRFAIAILLSQSIVDNVDQVLVAGAAHHKVVWFDVSVKDVHLVEELQTTNDLIGKHQDSFVGQTISVLCQQILKGAT